MPVRDAGRCGRGSGGRLAGFGGDGQLRLTGSRAIPRGSGRRPCWGVRAALVRGCAAGTVGQVCHSRSPRPPLTASRSSVRTPRQPIRAFCGPSACRSHRVPQRDPLPQRNCRPPELPAGAERGGSAVLRPDVTLELQGGGSRCCAAHLQWGRGAARPMRKSSVLTRLQSVSLEHCGPWGPHPTLPPPTPGPFY